MVTNGRRRRSVTTSNRRTTALRAAVLACAIALVGALDANVALADGDALDQKPWLGVGIMPGTSGVLIREVIRDTPADEAGLKKGDEILTVAGTRVATPSDLKAVVGKHRIGQQVTLSVWRDGELQTMSAAVGARMSPDEILYRRLVGEEAPAFEMEVLYGGDSDSSGELGQPVVILQFFSLSCRDCVEQHRALSRLAERHSSKDLTIVAIGIDPCHTLDKWASRNQPSFTVACDESRKIFPRYDIEMASEPSLVVIDRTGHIIYAGVGGAANTERATEAAEREIRQRGRR